MKVSFHSYLKDIQRDLDKFERKARMKAARFLKKKLKEKTTSLFGASSNITKGINHKHTKFSSLVGFGPKAYAAHLIEFGTDSRFKKSGKGTGHIAANPWIFRTMESNSLAVMKILQEAWF